FPMRSRIDAVQPPAPAYPWYGIVSGADLEQGDILQQCPVLVVSPEAVRDPGTYPLSVQRQTVIVASQSCDLAVRSDGRCAIEDVILLPVYTKPELSSHPVYGKPQGWEEARK